MPSQIFTSGQAGDSRLFYQDPKGAYQQIANPTQLQDLAKQGLVQVGGQRAVLPQGATTPTAPSSNPSPSPTPTNTATSSMEASPGVYKSSALTDYYDNEIARNREAFNQAQGSLADINKQIASLYAGPSLQEQYNSQLASATTGIDQQIAQSTDKLKNIDVALAGVEQEVRSRLGQGQAPEAYIQAEIARQSTPLINERNALATNLNALQGQRQNIVQGVGQSLNLAQADQTRKLNLLGVQKQLADQTISTFNNLIEKGAAATDKERDNARQLFSQFLQQAPDFLTHLSEDEINQLQQGVIPYSALTKLGKTINEQKISKDTEATKQQIINEANRIIEQASQQGVAMDFGTALAQAKQRYAALYGGGAVSGIDFGSYNDGGTANTPMDISQGGDLNAFMSAIAKQESGGRYDAIGPKTANGNQAYGKYQVMDFNIPSWTKEAIGISMTPQQFLTSPDAQEAVARYKFSQIYNQYGDWKDVASVWFSGRPVSQAGNASDVTGTSTTRYVNNVLSMMGQPAYRQPNVGNKFNLPVQTETAAGTFITERNPSNGKFTDAFYSTKLGQKTIDNEMQAMQRFQTNPVYKDYQSLQDNAMGMKAIVDSGASGPADIDLVYQFMKILDPNSVVRGNEYEAAAKSGNVFTGAYAKFNGMFSQRGGFLSDQVKKDFINIMNTKLKEKTKLYNQVAGQFRDSAKNQGMNPDNVALTYKFIPFDYGNSAQGNMVDDPLGLGLTDIKVASQSVPSPFGTNIGRLMKK